MKKHRLFFLFILFFSFTTKLLSENFRVGQMHIIDFSEDYSTSTSNVGINESLYIKYPKDKTFLEGFEIEIKIPKNIAMYRDSVIYSFFENVSPDPKPSVIDYRGEKVFTDIIPPRLSINLQSFFDNSKNVKNSPYSTLLPFKLNANQESIVLRFQLAMKGVPESFFTSEFTVTDKPILKDEGILNLSLIIPEEPLLQVKTNTENLDIIEQEENNSIKETTPDKQNINVYIDDVLINDISNPIFLKTGIHHLSVISENYRNEIRTIVINQGKKESLEIQLKSITPEVYILAPENAKVFLDDIELENTSESIHITPGEHSVKYIIGDYELIKRINIQNGKTYEISLSFDIKIEESE